MSRTCDAPDSLAELASSSLVFWQVEGKDHRDDATYRLTKRRQHVVSYPVSHGGFINWIGFKTRPEMEGTLYEGKSAEEAPKEEILELFDGWEKEVQDMTQVRRTRDESPGAR